MWTIFLILILKVFILINFRKQLKSITITNFKKYTTKGYDPNKQKQSTCLQYQMHANIKYR
jgi:hypothetical protein